MMVHPAPPGTASLALRTVNLAPVMVSLSLAPAIRVRLAPRTAGPGTVRLLAMTWTVHEPGTGDGKPGTHDGAV